ncbi:MAG: hypothetical protein Q9M92_14170 [Enterobacterales bacterium]|nr:hypothetical protein [Enterobacterales bacterium]
MKFDDFSWILVLEAVLPFVILSLILIFTITAGRKKFKLAARRLILAVKNNEVDEKKAVYTFLTDNLLMDKKLAKKQVKKIMNERKFLIRNLVSGLLDKNIDAIADLNQDLGRVSATYHKLKPTLPEAPVVEEEVVEEPVAGDEEQVKQLNKDIKSLKQEVHITLTTLNNIFKEFSSMFGEDDVSKEQMSVEQIITAMESFSGAAATDDDSQQQASDANITETETETESDKDNESTPDLSEETESASESVADETKEETLDTQLEQSLKDMGVDDTALGEEVNDSLDSALDDIDSALDELELDASDDEPDWGDAFAESGDVMDSEKKD